MHSFKYFRPQLVLVFVLSSALSQALAQVRPATGSSSSADTSASSTQPLWSYQVKPASNYINGPGSQAGHYSATSTPVSSIFEAFHGLSQRQSALSGSPFLSILPIILIAAGGMLLLLPFLTMMIASPFGGGLGAGFNNGFGYPQMAAMGKKRSLNDPSLSSFGQKVPFDILENVSSLIEELTRKYSPLSSSNGSQLNKRSKAVNGQQVSPANDSPTVVNRAVNEDPSGQSATNPSGSISGS